jgi:hypothetical protein
MPALTPTPAQNLATLSERIRRLAPGRAVQLVAVTKSVDAATALELARAGAADLGENRIDALEAKAAALRDAGAAVRWHYLGHLQTNKARRAARVVDVLHSLDSADLADKLEKELAAAGRSMAVYLQVKLSGEPTKTGLERSELGALARHVQRCPHLRLSGLMAMAPLDVPEREAAARAVFRELRGLRDALQAQLGLALACSMGMSEDYAIALEEGADVLRIGSLLFAGGAA